MSMVKKIIIQIGKKEIELSLEDAKKLHGDLAAVFGSQAVYYYPQPTIYPYTPIWQAGTGIATTNNLPTITCSEVQMDRSGGTALFTN